MVFVVHVAMVKVAIRTNMAMIAIIDAIVKNGWPRNQTLGPIG